MTKPFPLKPIHELSKSRLDSATRELGELIAREQEGVRKLDLLQSYRAEYEERFREALGNGIGVEALRNYSAFMSRIDEAIEIQRTQLDQSQRQTEVGKQAWVSQRNKVKAFDTLQNRHLATETRRTAKGEQQLLDEHSANRHRERKDLNES